MTMWNICAYKFLSKYVLYVICMDIYRYSKLYANLIKEIFHNIHMGITNEWEDKKKNLTPSNYLESYLETRMVIKENYSLSSSPTMPPVL